MIVPSSGSQQYTLEARHLRDVYSKSYVTDSAEIVVYYWWLTQTALSADWDVMGVAWVVHDSLWNGSFVPLGRRLMLTESWALRTLKAASIDMVYAPPLPAAQMYNSRNEHWVLRLLLVSPTRTFLCLVFDPLCNKPYIAGANTEELAIVNLIAEREGIEPKPQKRWDRFLGEFGSVAFAIALLYSTLLHQEDGVSCHPTCLLLRCLYLGVLSTVASDFHKTDCGCCVRLHRQLCTIAILRMPPLLRPHPVGPWHGCMLRPIVHLAVRRAFFATTQPTSRALDVEFISVPCMVPVCVPQRYVWHCAIGECNLLPHWHALCWHSPWVTGLCLTSRLL